MAGVKLDPRRISSWLPEDPGSAQVPRAADADRVWALVQVWAGWAGDPSPQQRYWLDLIEAAQPTRVRAVAEEEATAVGWLIDDLADPFALEVHEPIEVAIRPGTAGLPILPPYIPRKHDSRVADLVARAGDGDSSIAVLVGGSSTGKTRACWEAVQALPTGWRLWHPIFPDRPEAFLAGLERLGPRTVVWLNDAQFYLLTSDPAVGERVAAGLRDLLRDRARAPVLVLATIWPRYWQPLTAAPAKNGRDLHAQARELLTGAGIEIPDAFTGAALTALTAAAQADPRLAAALEMAADGQVTQFLAGVPVLLERYRTASPAAKAVIHAAIDARVLGHGPALSRALLETAAPGYLTRAQWEEAGENWLDQALADATAPCRGARGPLTQIRPQPGRPALAQPHYRLADYLEQTGPLGHGAAQAAPASLWDALLAHGAHEDLTQIAAQARRRGLYRYAFKLYMAAGNLRSWWELAHMLQETGRAEEAITFYQRAAEAGESRALRLAAQLLQEAGRAEEAITFYQLAAEAGDFRALRRAAQLLRRAGRAEEAITWLRSRAEAGDTEAQEQAVQLLRIANRAEEAISWLRSRAEAGDTDALRLAAQLLQEAGRAEEAIIFYQRAAETGDAFSVEPAAVALQETGRAEEAITLYQRAAEAGDAFSLESAVEALREAGRVEEAISWLRSRAEAGDTYALQMAAQLLQEAGQVEEAISWLRSRAEAGDTDALRLAAVALREAGHTEEALTFFQRAAYRRPGEASDEFSLRWAVTILLEIGRIEEAITWLGSLAEAGDADALELTAWLLHEVGLTEEAISWLQSRADAGDTYAPRQAVRLLKEAGRAEEAISWLQSRAEVGDPDALQMAAQLLQEAGRAEEAISWLRSRAEAGDTDALQLTARLLQEAGRAEEAITYYRQATEAGDFLALRRMGEALRKAGLAEEAARLSRDGIEPGGQIADPWETGSQK